MADNSNQKVDKKTQNRVTRSKTKLVKQVMLTSLTVLRLVFPMTNNNNYMDLLEATTKQALEAIIGILEIQEEGLELVRKQGWMETWPMQDNPCTLLSNIEEIKQETFDQLLSTRLRKLGGSVKEVWHFAIAGSSATANLLKIAKVTINKAQCHLYKLLHPDQQ
jgi:hypothetical protein